MNIQRFKPRLPHRMPDHVPPVLLAWIAVLFFILTLLVWRPPGGSVTPVDPRYKLLKSGSGLLLHAVATTPAKIGLKAIQTNVTEDAADGMNGGFFWEGQLLSIAVINDRPVKGAPGDYGSGWYNIDRPRGTLVWDGATGRLSVQVTDRAEELAVTDRTQYWAQGGVSMGLTNENEWREQALAEEFPVMDEERLRSAMVYDTDSRIWLLVSDAPCTGPEFRSAIRETVSPGKLVDGIFLDGDGSSQLKLGGFKLEGDKRAVYQMITLMNG